MREGVSQEPAGPEGALPAQVEAVLFVAERPVTVSELARLLHASPDAVEDAVGAVEDRYQGGGLALQRHGDALQVVTDPGTAAVVQRFLGLEMSSRLSPAALETLAIVAYRQPVTRGQIEAVRGVNADGVLANLVARGLVETVGRAETIGRPLLYGTTFEFLRAFGLQALDELPPAGDLGPPSAPPASPTPSTPPAPLDPAYLRARTPNASGRGRTRAKPASCRRCCTPRVTRLPDPLAALPT